MRTHAVVKVVLAAGLLTLATQPLAGQGRFGDEEARLMREAAALESDGDLEGAERALRRLLEIDPVSTGGIYAFERVLRRKGEVVTLLPIVDNYLSRREDSGIRSLKLELLVEADSLDTMVAEAEAWLARSRTDETAYAEVARAYEKAFGHDRALQVLESGREELGGDALALAMGDHYAADGDTDAAVDEWVKAVGPAGSNTGAVRRRLEGLADEDGAAARRLVMTLAAAPEFQRRRAGTLLALELGLHLEALELAVREADALSGSARTAFLQEISVAANAAGVAEVASWAYAELSEGETDPGDRRMMEQRRAEAALLAGDTVAAFQALESVAASLPAGASDRRMVEARIVRIAAAAGDVDRLVSSWNAFRETYPGAVESDALAATASSVLLARGDVEGAVAALDGVDGPLSSVERAYLLLGAGEIEAGRTTLMDAAARLPATEATDVIQMATLLARVSGQSVQALANAGVQAHLGRGGTAARTLADQSFDLPETDRPLLLGEAARMADRDGDAETAADIRAELVAEYPQAPEAGEATLALARHVAGVDGGVDEAIRLLEDLITRRPGAAVVPEARLELERLRSRGS